MGQCLGTDVETKAAAGHHQAMHGGDSAKHEAASALAHLTGALQYSSWVELSVSCSSLRTADTFSKSDPMAILFLGGREVGRTEAISNNESPHFTT